MSFSETKYQFRIEVRATMGRTNQEGPYMKSSPKKTDTLLKKPTEATHKLISSPVVSQEKEK